MPSGSHPCLFSSKGRDRRSIVHLPGWTIPHTQHLVVEVRNALEKLINQSKYCGHSIGSGAATTSAGYRICDNKDPGSMEEPGLLGVCQDPTGAVSQLLSEVVLIISAYLQW